jgi:hypothetical protein
MTEETPIKYLNIYVPQGKLVSAQFIEAISERIPEDVLIHVVYPHECATLCEVGFDMDKFEKLDMCVLLERELIDL